MKINNEERFALSKLFLGNDAFSVSLISQLDSAVVIKREKTGVGFFSTIRFPCPVSELMRQRQWDWNFDHRDLMYGGSFMAYFEPPSTIVLEAVAHHGDWPKIFDSQAFVETR